MSIYKYIGIYFLLISKLRLRAASLKSRRENGTDGKEGKEEARRAKYLGGIGGSPLEGVREDTSSVISIVLDRR